MNIDELMTTKSKKSMPVGTQEVTFDRIQYKVDENKEVVGVYIYTKEYNREYLHFFEDENGDHEVNPQLDFLLAQLGCETRSVAEANACTGTVIKATKYVKEKDDNIRRNVSFNPEFKSE